MVLANLGITRTQEALAKTLGLNPPFGTWKGDLEYRTPCHLMMTGRSV